MLEQIVAEKKNRLDRFNQMEKIKLWESHLNAVPKARDFKQALRNLNGISMIVEIKRASPSAGILRKKLDVQEIAVMYEQAGASCISVLTEEKYFLGSIEDLNQVKVSTTLPVLGKDFIFTEYQVWESRVNGADCLLLIVALLSVGELKKLLNLTRELGLQALVEIHTENELEQALSAGSEMIGINNRDLETLQVDLKITERILPLIPDDIVTISESGISCRKEILALQERGIDAVLVGETLIRSKNPGSKIRELLGKPLEMKVAP